MTSRINFRLLLAAAATGGALLAWLDPSNARPPRLPAPAAHCTAQLAGLEWQGIDSCRICHAIRKDDTLGSPWGLRRTDRHSRAFEDLFNDRSKRIVKTYRRLDGSVPDDVAAKDPLCLKCHANSDAKQKVRKDLTHEAVLQAGVDCESCHGPAEKWLKPHPTADWPKTATEKAKFGFRPLTDLGVRAELCVNCHVGTPDAQVNHDLIAAGHPRLNFELAAYLSKLPRHWSAKAERQRYTDFEARLWEIGQAQSALRALELLEYRARPENKQPWPEFSEYDCYACHHELQQKDPMSKPREPRPGKKPGALPFGGWYLAVPRSLDPDAVPGNKAGADPELQGLLQEARALEALMETPATDRTKVAEAARTIAGRLKRWLQAAQTRKYDQKQVQELLRRLARDEADLANASWDSAVQLYLALAALDQALLDFDRSHPPALRNAVREMYLLLDFKSELDSPRDYDAKKLMEKLKEVRQAAGQ